MNNTSSLNAILFLTFQTVQKMHKGPTLQTSLLFLSTKDTSHPKSVALTDIGSTHCTPEKVKNIPHKVLILA